MNTAQEAEDALLLVSHMQRTILDNGVRQCFNALDNTGDTAMLYAIYTRNGLYRANMTPEDVEEATGIEPCDVYWAIEEDGWCGCYIDVEPCVVFETSAMPNGLPTAANAYLNSRDEGA